MYEVKQVPTSHAVGHTSQGTYVTVNC